MMILIFIYIFQFSAPPKLLIRKVSDPFCGGSVFFAMGGLGEESSGWGGALGQACWGCFRERRVY